jgi:hypothetical protein
MGRGRLSADRFQPLPNSGSGEGVLRLASRTNRTGGVEFSDVFNGGCPMHRPLRGELPRIPVPKMLMSGETSFAYNRLA